MMDNTKFGTNMYGTFYNCTSLEEVPNIPNEVMNMEGTFCNCTSLVSVPNITSSALTVLKGTFQRCTSLITAPDIPESVTNMVQTFYGCTALTGDITINAISSKLEKYSLCFNLTEKKIKLIGPDENVLINLKKSATPNTHITYEVTQ